MHPASLVVPLHYTIIVSAVLILAQTADCQPWSTMTGTQVDLQICKLDQLLAGDLKSTAMLPLRLPVILYTLQQQIQAM